MLAADLHHPAVSAAMAATAELVGMEVVFIGGLTADDFSFLRVVGGMPGVDEGRVLPRADSFCDRLAAGAPSTTADAEHDPAYADAPARTLLSIRSYVGVPVRDGGGSIVGTLCGIDRGSVPVPDDVLRTMKALGGVVEAHVATSDTQLLLRRTAAGWRVGSGTEAEAEDELTAAMALADLLCSDLDPTGRPGRADDGADELQRLQVAVGQLEHALSARVVVEQAIGVLAERHRLSPRAAFDRLRKAARSRGKRVHDLARMVVASVEDPSVPLPAELVGRH